MPTEKHCVLNFLNEVFPTDTPDDAVNMTHLHIASTFERMDDARRDNSVDFIIRLVEATIPKREYKARNAAILAVRYGLNDDTPRSPDQTGSEFGLTGTRVEQIVQMDSSMLRHPANVSRLLEHIQNPETARENL